MHCVGAAGDEFLQDGFAKSGPAVLDLAKQALHVLAKAHALSAPVVSSWLHHDCWRWGAWAAGLQQALSLGEGQHTRAGDTEAAALLHSPSIVKRC